MSNLPEGWYPHPSDPDTEVFWNGEGWSGDTRAKPGLVASEPISEALPPGLLARVLRLPLPVRVLVPVALVIVLVGLGIFLAQPRGSVLAEAECRAAAIDGMRAPSEAKIVELETRAVPQGGEQDDEWAEWIFEPVMDGTLEQFGGFTDVMGALNENSSGDKAVYKENAFVTIGKIDGTNGFGAVGRQGFLCAVVVNGTEIEMPAEIAYFG